MWFCVRCEVWYHYDCCHRLLLTNKVFEELEDFVEVPLLRGGAYGPIGTVPLVFSAAKTVQKIQSQAETTGRNWREQLDEALGQSAGGMLKEQMEKERDPLVSDVKCPKCDSE